MEKKTVNLKAKADEIIRQAEKEGAASNYFFLTTFKRYQVQLWELEKLEETMKEEGVLVTKEYVKGRKNLYSNPAVSEFNRTSDSANKTVNTLMRILDGFKADDENDSDPLFAIINGDSGGENE